MANAKKGAQGKSGRDNASAKLSKEMKADIEKMIDKRLSSIEKQLEKLKGGGSKGRSSKGNGRKTSGATKANKGKQGKSPKTKKAGGRATKRSNQRNEAAE